MKKILVIGQGYMGFPMSLLLAKSGYKVVGFDVDIDKVAQIESKRIPFGEPGLKELYQEVVLGFPKNYKASSVIEPADVFIISVPTPKISDKADMRFVYQASDSISTVLKDGNLIILESTSPPNSTLILAKELIKKTGKKFHIAYCPERAFPGNTIHELVCNDRLVGGIDVKSSKLAAKVYRSFSKGQVHETSSLTAEVCKLVENAYRDVNIAFANELSNIGDELGFNVREVIDLANKHPRVNILNPGPGVGGHCIPIDPLFLVQDTKSGSLIRTSRKINDQMPQAVVSKMLSKFGKKLGVVGVLGLSYKEGVDDYRESPALELIHILEKDGYDVIVHDPYVSKIKDKALNHYGENDLLAKSTTIVIATGHKQFGRINFNKHPNIKNILDARGAISPDKLHKIKANVATI